MITTEEKILNLALVLKNTQEAMKIQHEMILSMKKHNDFMEKQFTQILETHTQVFKELSIKLRKAKWLIPK